MVYPKGDKRSRVTGPQSRNFASVAPESSVSVLTIEDISAFREPTSLMKKKKMKYYKGLPGWKLAQH